MRINRIENFNPSTGFLVKIASLRASSYFARVVLIFFAAGFCNASWADGEDNAAVERQINSLIARMTLEEKIGQTALRGRSSRAKGVLPEDMKVAVREGSVGAYLNVMNIEELDELQRIAREESRLKIPLLFARDVIHGFKTIFPIPLGLAASWNPEHAYATARISAIEASVNGINWTFAPMMDIARDPRWGRIAESFGEDPYLASQFSLAMIKGFQTDDLSSSTAIAACAKHLVAYGAAEGGRDYNTALVPERELRDVYLAPFKAASDAGVATMMSSFNEVDGVPVTGSRRILTDILRKEWGFNGFVVSDWDSVTEMIDHGFARDAKHAAERAALAGLDMEMTSRAYESHLKTLVGQGRFSEKALDDLVRNILRVKFRLGLFKPEGKARPDSSVILSEAHLQKAKAIATESIVLLKNKSALLPLKQDIGSLAVIGPLADAPHDQMGTWVFDGRKENSVTPIQALRTTFASASEINFVKALDFSRSKSDSQFKEAIRAAKKSEVIVFFAGEESIISGEAHSRAQLGLPGLQRELLEELFTLGKPLVLVLMSGRPLTISALIEKSDAVLVAFHGGTMAGPAIADVLVGKSSPSGKLPITWPISEGQIPIYYNHKNTGRPPSEKDFVQMDDIPVEAWQSSLGNDSHYLDIGFKPAFPFGFGLSYSEFKYEDLKLSGNKIKLGETIQVSVKVTNVGNRKASEVVQLYIRDRVGDVTRPVKELKGFRKIALVNGQSQIVNFVLHTDDFAFTNVDMKRVTEPGMFDVWVSTSSEGGLKAEFEVLPR